MTKQRVIAALASLGAVVLATAVVFALRPVAPDLSLGVIYLFAVLPVAVAFGLPYAIAVSVLSMLAFNFFFLPPLHTFALRDSQNWVGLAVFLFTAVVVSELAARSRRRAAVAESREREATLLAFVSEKLLESGGLQRNLRAIADRTARTIGVTRAWIEVESVRRPGNDEVAHDLVTGDRHVGRLFVDAPDRTDPQLREQVLPALASLLGVATDRERFERKALDAEALRRSDAVKTAILRALSHDLRSPLTAIHAAAEGLESPRLELSDADRAGLLETIRVESERLERIVGNLLDLSRLQIGAAAPRPELWTADGLFARALDALGPAAESIEVALEENLPPVRVDAAQIERALVNLLENALRVSREPVRISASAHDGEVVLRVIDRGEGISLRDVDRIFDAFERGSGELGGGSGLGLAIARGFAQANGGRLFVEEPPDGRGASFALALPAAQAPARVNA